MTYVHISSGHLKGYQLDAIKKKESTLDSILKLMLVCDSRGSETDVEIRSDCHVLK
jgi:hypothetical protein